MMMKEKIVFWPLLVFFIGALIFGLSSQGKKKEATEELMREMEMATKKTKADKKKVKDRWDLKILEKNASADSYKALSERSPFFKVRSKEKVERIEVAPAKKEPERPMFKYKGKLTVGDKVKVVIEDQRTGKSFFSEEGDMIGDFLVLIVDDRKVVLQKKDGEEIVLSVAAKKDQDAD